MKFLRRNLTALSELVEIGSRHRVLILEMARREVSDRYSGQLVGYIWAVIHPIFMIGVYLFVFNIVFKIRLESSVDMPRNYTTYLLSGLVMWLAFQDVLAKSCTTITSNSALVKQFVFPIEILPIKSVLASMVTLVISLCVLIVYSLITNGIPPWTYLLLPVVLVMHTLAMIGTAYILSAIGVYFRDVKDMFQLFALLNIYMMPIVYLPGMVPELFRPIILFNPFSAFVLVYQDTLYFGRIEHPWAWLGAMALSSLSFVYGYRFFRRVKPMFGNAL